MNIQSFKCKHSAYMTQSSDIGMDNDVGMFSTIGDNSRWIDVTGAIGCFDYDYNEPIFVSQVGIGEYLYINIDVPLIGVVG